MTEPWTFLGESPKLAGAGTVTLVEGSSFCISAPSGDMLRDAPHGLFFRDTRFLSRFEVRLNHREPDVLGASLLDPFSAVFVARDHPGPVAPIRR